MRKDSFCKLALVFIAAVMVMMLGSCERNLRGGRAYLTFSLSEDYSYSVMSRIFERLECTKSSVSLPDTNDFILSVIASDGKSIYKGRYGDKPSVMTVSPGSYEVSLVSVEFSEPEFDNPQFGDVQIVVLNEEEKLAVSFRCTQLNSGIRIILEESFKNRFPTGELLLQSEKHSLQYSYNEKRTAFFLPCMLKLLYSKDGSEKLLLSRNLAAADMLTLKLSASPEDADGKNSFQVIVDTARNWYAEDYMIGSGKDGSTMENALEVTDLSIYLDAKSVWVKGYIVGGDLSTSKVKLSPPFSSEAHLAIAASAFVTERSECAGVELPASSTLRNELNLVDHPDYLGKKLYVRGNVSNYYGYPGIKTVKEYKIE